MKIKINDFLMAMGEICEKHRMCYDCPFFIGFDDHYECVKDGLHKKEIAQKVKDVTIKYMLRKKRSKDE